MDRPSRWAPVLLTLLLVAIGAGWLPMGLAVGDRQDLGLAEC